MKRVYWVVVDKYGLHEKTISKTKGGAIQSYLERRGRVSYIRGFTIAGRYSEGGYTKYALGIWREDYKHMKARSVKIKPEEILKQIKENENSKR